MWTITVLAQDLDPRWVGQWTPTEGSVLSLAVQDGYAYCGMNVAKLAVIDVGNPSHPVQVGVCDTVVNTQHLALTGSYICLVGEDVLQLVDTRDATNPQVLGTFAGLGGGARGVAAWNSYVFVGIGSGPNNGLQVVDISDPSDLRLAGSLQLEGSVSDVEVSDDFAYVTVEGATPGLYAIDVSNPQTPNIVGTSSVSGEVMRMAYSEGVCYVARHTGWTRPGPRLSVVDVLDPQVPRDIGSYPLPFYGSDAAQHYNVVIAGQSAFCYEDDSFTGLITVVGIQDPLNPRTVGRFNAKGEPLRCVAVSGDYAYLATSNGGIQVFELMPANLRRIASVGTSLGLDVEVQGGFAYLTTDIRRNGFDVQVVDISDPESPRAVGQYAQFSGELGIGEYTIRDMALSGNYAYAAVDLYHSQGGLLQVLDLSLPAQPRGVASIETRGNAVKVNVASDYAYVIEEHEWDNETSAFVGGGLRIVDVSDPVGPREEGYYFCEWPTDIAVSDHYAYITAWQEGGVLGGLHVVDIAEPREPKALARLLSQSVSAVGISGDLACVLDGDGNLSVVNISQPEHPEVVGRLESVTCQRGLLGLRGMAEIVILGNHVYALGDVLVVVDVSDPANPRRLGGNTGVYGSGIAVLDDRLYVAGGLSYYSPLHDRGLHILNMLNWLRFGSTEAGLTVQWDFGNLQFAPTTTGPWTDLQAASPMPLSPIGPKGFFRVKVEP